MKKCGQRILRKGRCIISILNITLLCSALFCTICLVWVFLGAATSGRYELLFTPVGIHNMQEFWCEYKALFVVLFSSITLFVASYQLQKYIDVETCRSLGELRTKLNDDKKKIIHHFLLEDSDQCQVIPSLQAEDVGDELLKYSDVELFDYLGTIELGAIMLYRGVIDIDEFDNQFGYRVRNIRRNEQLKEHIQNEENNYKYLHYAISELERHNKIC